MSSLPTALLMTWMLLASPPPTRPAKEPGGTLAFPGAEGFGAQRPAAVARELTKTHEEVRRGTLGELAAWAREREVLGEIVIVVGGSRTVEADAADLVGEVLERTAAGERMKDAARAVAAAHEGVTGRELYALALERRALCAER